jgi:hypothetical protein
LRVPIVDVPAAWTPWLRRRNRPGYPREEVAIRIDPDRVYSWDFTSRMSGAE